MVGLGAARVVGDWSNCYQFLAHIIAIQPLSISAIFGCADEKGPRKMQCGVIQSPLLSLPSIAFYRASMSLGGESRFTIDFIPVVVY